MAEQVLAAVEKAIQLMGTQETGKYTPSIASGEVCAVDAKTQTSRNIKTMVDVESKYAADGINLKISLPILVNVHPDFHWTESITIKDIFLAMFDGQH
jgi:hypothetical protein